MNADAATPRPTFPRVSGDVAFATLLLLALAALGIWERTGLEFPRCNFLAITGVPCPTCGGTRAMVALGRGDVFHALATNPLVAATVLALVCWPLARFLPTRFRRRFRTRRAALATVAILVALNWAYLFATLPR